MVVDVRCKAKRIKVYESGNSNWELRLAIYDFDINAMGFQTLPVAHTRVLLGTSSPLLMNDLNLFPSTARQALD